MMYSATPQIDYPTRCHEERAGQLVTRANRTEDDNPRQRREHLRAGAESDCVTARHPRAVATEVSSPYGNNSQQDAHQHCQPDDEPYDYQRLAIFRRARIEKVHPETGERHERARGNEDAPGDAVPTWPSATERWHELQRSEQAEHGHAHDVHHNGDGRSNESRV